MALLITDEPDVELREVGIVEVRFNTPKAKEWAIKHHLVNKLTDPSPNSVAGKSGVPENTDGVYKCRITKFDANSLFNQLSHSGLSVIRDPRLSGNEKLRWNNSY